MGGYAYVAVAGYGLQVVDTSVTGPPELVGSVDTPGSARGVAISGRHAYVADYSSGLQVIDITNPQSPQIVGSVMTPGVAICVATSSTHAYVGIDASEFGGSGLFLVIDITNPVSPLIVGSVDLQGTPTGIAVSGGYAYVTEEWSSLQVIDITDPQIPQIKSTVNIPNYMASCVALLDNYAYVGCGVFLMGLGFIQVFEIDDPENPQAVGDVTLPTEVRDLVISGNHAYFAGKGLYVIDIVDRTNPHFIGGAVTQGWANCAAASDDYIFVGDSDLQVLSMQCPSIAAIADDHLTSKSELDIPSAGVSLAVHPNPFNPRTTITFTIDHPQNVELCIFDMTGKRIAVLADRSFQAGGHSIDWQGKDVQGRAVASGTYLVRMVTDERVTSEKMMLIR